MQAVEFKDVDFSYRVGGESTGSKTDALKGLNLTIEKGSFVALLGRNGSGKSTLARLINGLLKPTRGSVTVLGKETSDKKNLFEIRKSVGMVFQNPDNQQVASIVEDDVAFGPENIGMSRDEMIKSVDFALKAAGIENLRKREAAKLSGGQKQRAAIAGAIAVNPEILVLDESTSMLDPRGRREVIDVARSLNKERGMTVIDITHYMDEAAKADRIYVLDKGAIRIEGTPEYVFSKREILRECGLELPGAAIVAEKLRQKGVPISLGVLTLDSLAEELCESLRKG